MKELKKRLAVPAVVVEDGKIRALLDRLEERGGSRLALQSLYQTMHGHPPGDRVPFGDAAAIKQAVVHAFPNARYYDSRKDDELGNYDKGFEGVALKSL